MIELCEADLERKRGSGSDFREDGEKREEEEATAFFSPRVLGHMLRLMMMCGDEIPCK